MNIIHEEYKFIIVIYDPYYKLYRVLIYLWNISMQKL